MQVRLSGFEWGRNRNFHRHALFFFLLTRYKHIDRQEKVCTNCTFSRFIGPNIIKVKHVHYNIIYMYKEVIHKFQSSKRSHHVITPWLFVRRMNEKNERKSKTNKKSIFKLSVRMQRMKKANEFCNKLIIHLQNTA